tara:strand:- start:180 stop:410 length:231 start_codon:yes stop_codon:yes gene_type:complete
MLMVTRKSLEKIFKYYLRTLKNLRRKMAKLTNKQIVKLQAHSAHHTKKHMSEMRTLMRGGKSFNEAHKIAMKKVGK